MPTESPGRRRLVVAVPLTAEQLRRVEEVATGFDVVHLPPPSDEDALAEALSRAEAVFGWPPPQLVFSLPNIRWVHTASAGVDIYTRYLDQHPQPAHRPLFTNSSGVFGLPASEHLLAMMLYFARGLHRYTAAMRERSWEKGPRVGGLEVLYGKTLGILGLGDIGLSLARRAQAFGMRVVGLRRRPGQGKPPEVDEVLGPDGIEELFVRSHHLAVTLPATAATYHLVDRRVLAAARPGMYLYNIGRGSTIDEEALVWALSTGRLGGAGLDVFEKEPLPPESPLWSLPNVLVTPHVGGRFDDEGERLLAQFLDNLARYVAGKPLAHVVDLEAGY